MTENVDEDYPQLMNNLLNNLNGQMMNNNPMIMNNNPLMINNNPLMINNNPMIMDVPMLMNAGVGLMMNNQNRNIIERNNKLFESNDNFYFNQYNNLSENKKKLLQSIINFFQENGFSQINMENKCQINKLIKHLFYHNTDVIGENYKLHFFHYIKTNKKRIIFFNHEFNKIVIDIPSYITKLELYTIAQNFASYSSKILLIHENKILNKDESNINELSNDDIIVIIENKLYPDRSFYNELQKKYPESDKKNIIIKFPSDNKKNYTVNGEVTIKELLKAISEDNGLDERDCFFLLNGKKLRGNINIKELLKSYNQFDITLFHQEKALLPTYGKILKGESIKTHSKIIVETGSLEPIKVLFSGLFDLGIKVNTIFIGSVKLKKDSDNCLSFYGIKDNFNFTYEIDI